MSPHPFNREPDGASSSESEAGIEACNECAALCERVEVFCSLAVKNPELARLAVLLKTCADVCMLTARLIARQSEFLKEYCALCAEVCHTSHEECSKHADTDDFAGCAEACLMADRACQRLAV
jgi:hypothetical protein